MELFFDHAVDRLISIWQSSSRRLTFNQDSNRKMNFRESSVIHSIELFHSPTHIGLGNDIFHDIAVNVRQAKISPGIAIRQLRMVEAQQVQNRRMPIVNVALSIDGNRT